jgi:hypothetical protein
MSTEWFLEEYKLIQAKIDKVLDSQFQVRSWSISLLTGFVVGVFATQRSPLTLIFALPAIRPGKWNQLAWAHDRKLQHGETGEMGSIKAFSSELGTSPRCSRLFDAEKIRQGAFSSSRRRYLLWNSVHVGRGNYLALCSDKPSQSGCSHFLVIDKRHL